MCSVGEIATLSAVESYLFKEDVIPLSKDCNAGVHYSSHLIARIV